MSRFVTAGAGFLLAVLWFDLMFDVQVIGKRGVVLPEAVLASIAGYYRRVTSAARPMNRLIATVMVATLAALVVEVAHVHGRGWAPWTSLGLAGAPIVLAASHTVPGAVRLGSGSDPPERQSALARSILRDHLLCLVLIAALLVVQLAAPGLD